MAEHISLDQYHTAACELSMLDGVLTAHVETEHPDLDQACVIMRVDGGYERVPPRIHRAIATHGLGTRPDLGGRSDAAHRLVIV